MDKETPEGAEDLTSAIPRLCRLALPTSPPLPALVKVGVGRTWHVYRTTEPWPYSSSNPLVIRVKRGDPAPFDRHVWEALANNALCRYAAIPYQNNGDGYSIQINDYIPGVSASTTSLPFLSSLCDTLIGLHRPSGYGPRFTGQWWMGWVDGQYSRATEYLLSATVDRARFHHGNDCARLLDNHRHAVIPVRTSLIHGDLSPSNVIVHETHPTHLAGLIDWDTVRFGDYLWDLAILASFYDEIDGDGAVSERILGEYHYGITVGCPDGLDQSIHPGLTARFWYYYLVISLVKLADHHKRNPQMDLTRAYNRVNVAYFRLNSI